MSGPPFILADRDRAEQFALLANTRGLHRTFDVWTDAHGVVWARRLIAGHWFAVSLLGPGWAFDPYAQQRRAEDLSHRRREMEESNVQAKRQALECIVADLRLGAIAERVLWTIYQQVVRTKRSVVRIPDTRLARAVWGADSMKRPRDWRRTLRTIFESLCWLHVAERSKDGKLLLGERSALLTHAADLRGSSNDGCDDDCPQRDGAPHGHFLVNVGRGFLGVLEQFAESDEGGGVRTYEFRRVGRKEDGPTLQGVGKSGRLTSIYLPAKLGDPAVCREFTPGQHRLLQAIVRETTRKSPRKGKARDRGISEAETFVGNLIPGIQRKGTIECPQLDPDGRYVGFNGSKLLKGLGYRLTTPGGWLAKAGYDRDDLGGFFADLTAIAGPLELIAVGIRVATKECIDLDSLQTLALTRAGRRELASIHLRIFTTSDYVLRWNRHFGWVDEGSSTGHEPIDSTGALMAEIRRKGISQRALAGGIEADPSFLNKILAGKKRWPASLLERATTWIAAQPEPEVGQTRPSPEVFGEQVSARPLLPLLTAAQQDDGSMLELALAYRARGWSVVPQDPGAKQPCVKWKPFQERRPTGEELTDWFTRWPQAGLTVVLGPVSGLLVVDVDGAEAHETLLERLGGEPVAPRVRSGSDDPNRYHLFFRCPDVPTKAKATPWHPKLEFRGQGGIVVIPPSLHKSGRRYAWVEERSPDDLPLPQLPAEILTALQPPRPASSQRVIVEGEAVEEASPSTQEFLNGKYADGPDWNGRLFRAACDLAARGMSREEAEPLLLAGAKPWDESNESIALRTIESAFSQPRESSKY